MPFWPSMNRTPLPAICRCRRIDPQPNEFHEEERHKIDIRRCKGKELVQIKGDNDLLPMEESNTYQLLLRAPGTSESYQSWVEAWPRVAKESRGEKNGREIWGGEIGERGTKEKETSRQAAKIR